MTPRVLKMLTIFVAVAVTLGVVLWYFRSGVRVTVNNVGNTPMLNVVVHVTGRAYWLGDISPGESSTVYQVKPQGESGVEIEFSDPQGQRERKNVGCYLEYRGYQGKLEIDVRGNKITHVHKDITVGLVP